MKSFLLNLLLIFVALGVEKRPNILFAISDDQSWPHASAYGDAIVKTPAFDRVASMGVLIQNAFCAAPQCSPSRAAILTGRQIWQLEEAGVHGGFFPSKFKSFTHVLAENGYHVGYTGKGWSPGNFQHLGWKENPVGKAYNSKNLTPPTKAISKNDYTENFKLFLQEKKGDAPFFFWYGAAEPHRDYEYGSGAKSGKDLSKVNIPSFLINTEVVKNDMLDYYLEIEWFDRHLAQMLDHLEKMGELENTIIIVTADNGMPFPRAKANNYEYGTHVPLAICWGKELKKGQTVNTPVSLAQLSPTILSAVGLATPETVTQKSFLPLLKGEKYEQDAVFTGRERHTHARFDNLTYPCRTIRTGKYLLIHNLKPERNPAGDFKDKIQYEDIDSGPAKIETVKIGGDFLALAVGKRNEFELYDVETDPYNLVNLAEKNEFKEIFINLKSRLHEQLKKDGDPRFNGYGEIFESYPRVSSMRPDLGGFYEQNKYNPKYIQSNQLVDPKDIGKGTE